MLVSEKHRDRLRLLVLASINFVHIMDFMIMMPLGDLLMKMFQISPQAFSLLVSAYTFHAGIAGFVAAFFIDRFDRKKALIVVTLGLSLGTLACAIASSYWMLMAARAITGVFGGIISALVLSIVSDLYTYEKRGEAMGILTAAFSAAAVLGVPVGLYLASVFNWHIPFLSIGILGGAITLAVMAVMPSMRQHIKARQDRPSPLVVLTTIARAPNQLYALLLGSLLILGHFIIIPFIAPYMIRNVGITQEEIPLIYFLGGLLTIFTGPLVGRFTDRMGAFRVFAFFMPLSFIPVLFITHMPPISLFLALVVTTVFFITSNGRFIPAQTLITGAVGQATRGSFLSVRSSVQELSSAFSSYLGGLIVVESANGQLEHYPILGYISVALGIACLLVARKIWVVKEN
jgi:predicted MFS family arabinose efflux permease